MKHSKIANTELNNKGVKIGEKQIDFPQCNQKNHQNHIADLICVEKKCMETKNGDLVFCNSCESEGLHQGHSFQLFDLAISSVTKRIDESNEEEIKYLQDIGNLVTQW